MKKWIKIAAAFLGILVLIAISAIILLITLVNPNRFKPFIAEKVHQYTGRQLTIEGDLSWSFYPYLGIKVGHTELSNPPGFQQKIFAELDSANVGVKLLPLFYAKIESSGITLYGLTLNLIRNADGKTNWQDLQRSHPTSTSASMNTDPSQSNASNAAMAIVITGVDVSQSTINWIDDQAKQRATIDQLEFQAKNIASNRFFPITTTFNFSLKNPATSGKMSFSTKALFNLDKKMYQFKKMDLSAQIKQGGKDFKINTNATMSIDMANQLAELSDWKGDFANIKWTGKLIIKNLTSQPNAAGYIQTQAFALQDVLASLGQTTSDSPKASNVKANFNFNFDTTKKTATALQKLSLQGLVKADDLQLQKIKAGNLVAHAQLQNGVLSAAPVSAVFYQGNLRGNVRVNLNTPAPVFAFNAALVNVQTEPLVADLTGASKLKLSGVGNISLQGTTNGADKNVILRNLNGTGKLSVTNGVLKGVDIAYLANTAYAIMKRRPSSSTNSEQTKFGDLTGSISIRNGVVSNNDLLVNMPSFITKGKGEINLVNQQINYALETKSKQDPENDKNDLGNLYGLTIPIKITGSLDNPTIALDAGDLMKQTAKMQLEKNKDKIKEQIGKAISGQGGELLKNLLGN